MAHRMVGHIKRSAERVKGLIDRKTKTKTKTKTRKEVGEGNRNVGESSTNTDRETSRNRTRNAGRDNDASTVTDHSRRSVNQNNTNSGGNRVHRSGTTSRRRLSNRFALRRVESGLEKADEHSENRAFKALLEDLEINPAFRHLEDAEVYYKPEDEKGPVKVQLKHSAGSIVIEGKKGQGLKLVIQMVTDEALFKQVKCEQDKEDKQEELDKKDKLFEGLYKKLHNPEVDEAVLELLEVKLEDLKDTKARIFRKTVGTERIIRVNYDKKAREFIVKKKGSLEEAIAEMDKHLDYVNASVKRPSWMIGNDWVDIFDTLIPTFYTGAEVFHKLAQRKDKEGHLKYTYTVKLGHELEAEIQKTDCKIHHFDMSKVCSDKFRKKLVDYRQDFYGRSAFWRNSFDFSELSSRYSQVTERDAYKGKFKKLWDRHDGVAYYKRNVPFGWRVLYIKSDSSMYEADGYSLDVAITKVKDELKFKSIDITKDDKYKDLVSIFNKISEEYRKQPERSMNHARVYHKHDTTLRNAEEKVHVIRVTHPYWGESRQQHRHEKEAIKMMVDLLTFIPVNAKTFYELFRKEYSRPGDDWSSLLRIRDEFASSRLYYKKSDGKHILKLESPYIGPVCQHEENGFKSLEKAIEDLYNRAKEKKGKKQGAYVFYHPFLNPEISNFESIKVTEETEEGVFKELLKDLKAHFKDQDDKPEVLYSRGRDGFVVSVNLVNESNPTPKLIMKQTSYVLEVAISNLRYNFNYIEVKEDDLEDDSISDAYRRMFIKIRKRIKEEGERAQDNFRILKKEDKSNLYHPPPCWLIKVEHNTLGFQKHGKDEENAIETMLDHLKYHEIKIEALMTKDECNHGYDKLMKDAYGKCKVFQKFSKKSKIYTIKIDHPDWGLQLLENHKELPAVKREILKRMWENKDKARTNFLFDGTSLSAYNNALETSDNWIKITADSEEYGKIQPLIHTLEKTFKENKEYKNISVFHRRSHKKGNGIKVVHNDYFYERFNHAGGLEELAKTVASVMEFQEIPEANVMYRGLRSAVDEKISNYLKRHGKTIERAEELREFKIYRKKFEKDKVFLEAKVNSPRRETTSTSTLTKWSTRLSRDGKSKKGVRSITKGYIVKVDHPVWRDRNEPKLTTFGFTKYGATEEQAIDELVKHYTFMEVTEEMHSTEKFAGVKDDVWTKTFEVMGKKYGWCRLFHKVASNDARGTKEILRVDHEIKGLQYQVEDEDIENAFKVLYGLLKKDGPNRTLDFAFESAKPLGPEKNKNDNGHDYSEPILHVWRLKHKE